MSGYGCFISLAGDCPDGEPSGDSVIITDSGFAIGGVSDARERLLSGAAFILESVTKISVSKNLISNLSPWLSTIPLVGLSILVSTSADGFDDFLSDVTARSFSKRLRGPLPVGTFPGLMVVPRWCAKGPWLVLVSMRSFSL